MELIDISRELLTAPVYPGDPFPELRFVSRIEDGADCNLGVVETCLHTGTHADAPLHFIPDAPAIDDVELASFIGPCRVIAAPAGEITGEFVNLHFPRACERLLIKSGGKAFFMDSAAQEAAALPLKLIGTDSLSIGRKGDQIRPHRAFLSKNIAVLEGLMLDHVPPGDYFLMAFPLKIWDAEAAPVRAVLLKGHLFWGGKAY